MSDAVNDNNLIVRLDERTKQIVDLLINNDKVHEAILSKIDKLTLHVNHENELMDKRITTIELCGSPTVKDMLDRLDLIENYIADQQSQKKGANFIYQVAIAGFGVLLGIITIAEILGII